MNAFVVFSIWIICVLCTIIVAPINVNFLKVFEHHFNLSAVHSETKILRRLYPCPKSQRLLVFWAETFSYIYI